MTRKDVNELFAKALDSPDFRRALLQVSQEKTSRPVRTCRCVALEIPEIDQTDGFTHIAPGTVTAFVAKDGDPLLEKLTEAVRTNDSREFNLVTDQIKKMAAEVSRKIVEAGVYVESPQRSLPSIAEIGYANKTLVSHVHVDDILRVHVHGFPYNGGYLDRNKFSMLEYYQAGSDTPLICVLIIRPPKLSDIEREALRLVPSDSSANNIGLDPVGPTTPALMAFFVVAAEAAARFIYNEFVNFYMCILAGQKGILASIPDVVLEGEDFQNMLKSLPPEVTAAELLRIRKDLLLQTPPK